MKKLLPLFLLLTALHARADLVITLQTEESRQPPRTIVIKTHDDKYRTDVSDTLSSITDLVSGDIILINHQAKNYRLLSGLQLEAGMDIARKAQSNDPITPVAATKIVDTGKSEKIEGYDAEIYTAQNPYGTYTYWVVKDYPDYGVVEQTLKKIRARNDALNKVDKLTPDLSTLDGIVIKFTVLSSGGKAATTTLLSAKIQPLDESEFHVPDGYTQLKPGSHPPLAIPTAPTPAPTQ